MINDHLGNELHKLYLLVLQFILPYFTNLNLEMQSEAPKIHELYRKVELLCRTVLGMFVKQSHLRECDSLQTVSYKNSNYIVSMENICL